MRRFKSMFLSVALLVPVLDAVSANISILKSQTVFHLKVGTLHRCEDLHPNKGSCIRQLHLRMELPASNSFPLP